MAGPNNSRNPVNPQPYHDHSMERPQPEGTHYPPSMPILRTARSGEHKLAKVTFALGLGCWLLFGLSIIITLVPATSVADPAPNKVGMLTSKLMFLGSGASSIASLVLYAAFRIFLRLNPTLHDNGMARGGAILGGIYLAFAVLLVAIIESFKSP